MDLGFSKGEHIILEKDHGLSEVGNFFLQNKPWILVVEFLQHYQKYLVTYIMVFSFRKFFLSLGIISRFYICMLGINSLMSMFSHFGRVLVLSS